MQGTRIKWAYYCTFRSPIAPDLGNNEGLLITGGRKEAGSQPDDTAALHRGRELDKGSEAADSPRGEVPALE